MRCWAKPGALDRMFDELRREQVMRIKFWAVSLDGASVKVHPGWALALLEKNGPPTIEKSRGG